MEGLCDPPTRSHHCWATIRGHPCVLYHLTHPIVLLTSYIDGVPRVPEPIVLELDAGLVAGRLAVALDDHAVEAGVAAEPLEEHVVALGAVLDAPQKSHRGIGANSVLEVHLIQVLDRDPAENGTAANKRPSALVIQAIVVFWQHSEMSCECLLLF